MAFNVSRAEYYATLETVDAARFGDLRQYYDTDVEWYDEFNLDVAKSRCHLNVAQAFLSLALATSSIILEIGPASGSLGLTLHKAGYHNIHAMDISPKMLHLCKSLGDIYKRFIPHYVKAGSPLPVAPRTYDALLMSNVVYPWAFSFEEVKHVTSLVKPGGVVAFDLTLGDFSGTFDGNFTDEGQKRNTDDLIRLGYLKPVPGFYPKIFNNHYSYKPGVVYMGYVT